tara:strand:- start:78 stop:761 length:684 start_codon:yes stop_codon:yes gene_type:complete
MNEIKHNTTSQTWHSIADENNLWVKWRFEILKKYMKLSGINFTKNYKCLDVGCGNNSFALNLEQISNYTIDQIDVDPLNLVNKKKGRGSLFEYNINTKREDLKNKYDIIFLLDVLEHIKNDSEFLESCYFHLKKDGCLVINVPSIPLLFSKYDDAVGHIRRYRKKELKNLLEKNKFTISILKYWGFLLIPLLFLRKLLINFSKKNDHEIIKKEWILNQRWYYLLLIC